MNLTQTLSTFGFLIIATALEVTGDSLVRIQVGLTRLALMLVGAVLLFG